MDDTAFCEVSNIPSDFCAADLRRFFAAFIEAASFVTFHYLKRVEADVERDGVDEHHSRMQRYLHREAARDAARGESQHAEGQRRCCVVQLKDAALAKALVAHSWPCAITSRMAPWGLVPLSTRNFRNGTARHALLV